MFSFFIERKVDMQPVRSPIPYGHVFRTNSNQNSLHSLPVLIFTQQCFHYSVFYVSKCCVETLC